MGITIRKVAEAPTSEDLFDLVINEYALLQGFGVIIQSDLEKANDLSELDLVVQDMDITKRYQFEAALKEVEQGDVLHSDISDFIADVCLTKQEGIDTLILCI